MKDLLRNLYRFLSSYGLSCVLFFLLFLLTLMGTLEQIHLGLFDVQKKYFESVFLIHELFGVLPIPLPGAYLVMSALAVNLFLGGIVRARKGPAHWGVLLGHIGIVVLLLGAGIQYRYSESGNLTLYEGEQSSEFESYYEWELAIADASGDGSFTEHIIPGRQFMHAGARTFRSPALPFEVCVERAFRNSLPQPVKPGDTPAGPVVDGFTLVSLPPDKQAERNAAGVYVTIRPASGEATEAILWGVSPVPLTVEMDGKPWVIDLRKERFQLPFAVALDKFTHEMHPGTQMPRKFESDVRKVENGIEQSVTISMNAPLRHRGYTLYQASWGPPDAGPGEPLFSVFAVVNNPADQFPLYACIIISVGLCVHFARSLVLYLREQSEGAAS
ncbi:MAG TPA: cytochrome c biogenesis protein ResB [Candidatus Hydrogenedentes bacterium]|nr:cytochrome c biogenesis protein ResB [Candidatus Hydrogenedentota bacterium]NLT59736.1 cytochrome c biogenesis protein ResB [Candidatus Hydrogenedentota bacterium]HNZ19371.1 cytochrome c biogenesis protein ResB [Candidatus Hydrogenedentota bacterium]HOH34713.1 cytochrome c biogenesis protein ResB [Candidatus Hydrogenedentota bacterium]HPA03493.1 cytochrome c biogenesis protein ResB [Candidatus Hydrogenedentota bacterium]